MEILNVLDGPYGPFTEDDKEVHPPEGMEYFLVCTVKQPNGKVGANEVWFSSLNECYQVTSHFWKEPTPLEMNLDKFKKE